MVRHAEAIRNKSRKPTKAHTHKKHLATNGVSKGLLLISRSVFVGDHALVKSCRAASDFSNMRHQHCSTADRSLKEVQHSTHHERKAGMTTATFWRNAKLRLTMLETHFFFLEPTSLCRVACQVRWPPDWVPPVRPPLLDYALSNLCE